MKYVVITSGAKQYPISGGDVLKVEKLDIEKDKPVGFDNVLLSVDDDKVEIGKPYLTTKVKGTVVDNGKGKKIKVFKYKAKTGYHKTIGHRQNFTKVKIETI